MSASFFAASSAFFLASAAFAALTGAWGRFAQTTPAVVAIATLIIRIRTFMAFPSSQCWACGAPGWPAAVAALTFPDLTSLYQYSWCSFAQARSEEHTSELQSRPHLACRLLLE